MKHLAYISTNNSNAPVF